MNYIEAKYLKHVGEQVNAKVTLEIKGTEVEIWIRDYVFHDFKKALNYLKIIALTELNFEGDVTEL